MKQKGNKQRNKKWFGGIRMVFGKLAMAAAILAVLTLGACKTAEQRHSERVSMCSNMCKEHPEIESMTKDEGGMFFLLFGGYQEEQCVCSRGK